MGDAAALGEWIPKFEAWKEKALPMFSEGKAKEAFGTYPWFTTTGEPFARLARPAQETRFGLVTTGGYSIEGEQEPFTGLPSFDATTPQINTIPSAVDREKLRIHHVGYDHRFAEEDINVNLPFDRMSELVAAGEIGSFASDTPVLMGLQPHVGPLLEETIPTLVQRFEADDVEAVLLVPS
jgi:D-proline reductase (dithiol) PrdB